MHKNFSLCSKIAIGALSVACAGTLFAMSPAVAQADEGEVTVSSVKMLAANSGWLKQGSSYVWKKSDGTNYTGWLVTDALPEGGTGPLERYWLSSDGTLATSRLISADEAGWWAYATPSGKVVRGKYTDTVTGTVYLANNDGCLENPGWVVSDAYGDGLQRYYVDDTAHACVLGYSDAGWAHYTTSAGYVLRGKLAVDGVMLLADNDGKLATGNGWLITDVYGDSLQRYFLTVSEHGLPGARLGKFEYEGLPYYGREDTGYVVRGSWTSPEGVKLFADNDGVIGNRIMGESENTAQQMVAYYRAQDVTYPAEALGKGGAPDIETFCKIICEEAEAEGVRAEIVFTQAMLETGWLQFGGDVKVEQFNFAGIGATGNGVPGNSFKNVREGLRAQVQHLKAYASTEPLNNPCVDPRFGYVKRGSAQTMEQLAGKWAASSTYGKNLDRILTGLSKYSK